MTTTDPVQRVVEALEAHGCRPRANGNGWQARCPAHDGRDADSLSVAEGSDGRVLLTCHSKGCTFAEIVAALELEPADAFPRTVSVQGRDVPARTAPAAITATYGYTDADGELVFEVVRLEPKGFRQRRPDGNGGWTYNLKGIDRRPLYRLHELPAADLVLVPEGEKDADNLAALGFTATTSAQGAGSAHKSDWSPLAGKRVVLIPDNDEAGAKYRDEVAELVTAAGAAEVRVLELPELPAKGDVSDWLAAGHGREELEALVAGAPEWAPAGRLKVRSLDEVLALEIPPPEPVVDPAIFTDEIVQIVAFRGTGKTFLGFTVGVALAAGIDPLPGWTVPKPRPVLYLDGELPMVRLRDRLSKVKAGLGVNGPVPFYLVPKTDPENRGRFRSLSTPEGRADVTACVDQIEARHGQPPVVFLDSLSTLLDGTDENSRESFADVGEWMADLRGRGVVVVFFHHTGWNQEHGRGSSAREDLIDTNIKLRAPGDRESSDGARFEVIFDKTRNFEPGQAVNFELRLDNTPAGGVVWSRAAIGERQQGDRRAAILDAVTVSPGCSANHVCRVVDGRKAEILESIDLMVAAGELVNEGRGQAHKLHARGSRPTISGTGAGTSFSTDGASKENTDGNRTEPPRNHPGTGAGPGTCSAVPTPIRGGGNQRGTQVVPILPDDPFDWSGPPKKRLDELLGRMTTVAAVEKVRAEFERKL